MSSLREGLPPFLRFGQIVDIVQGKIPLSAVEIRRHYYRHLGLIKENDKSEIDWLKIEKDISDNRNWTPHQISQMTYPEIYMVCSNHQMKKEEMLELMGLYSKLTIDQRVELALLETTYNTET